MTECRKESVDSDQILRGWKEIEKYVGLSREIIIRQGYPVMEDQVSGDVTAMREDLLRHAMR